MNLKKIKLLNNVVFYSAILYTFAVLAKTYYDRSKLPEGVCPIDNNNVAIYIGIAVLVVSFIGSTWVTVLEKKQKKSDSL